MNKKHVIFTLLTGFLVFALFAALFPAQPVNAQTSETVLSIEWRNESGDLLTEICDNKEVTVALTVDNVTDLFGYDAFLMFDPTAIQVISIQNSGWIRADFVLRNVVDNTRGIVWYAVTQLDNPVPQTGSDDLLYITLKVLDPTKNIGITINRVRDAPHQIYETKLSNSLSQAIPFTVGNPGVPDAHACQIYFPGDSKLEACASSRVQVMLSDVANLWAYEFFLTYDPLVVQLASGTPLTNGSVIQCPPYPGSGCFEIKQTSTPGVIRYAITQLDPTLPVFMEDLSAVLLNIDFNVLQVNMNSGITITDVLMTDRDGIDIGGSFTNRTIWTYPCEDPNAVDLLSFDALRKPRKAILTWETASELNNIGFNIYRSGFEDGILKKRNKELIPAKEPGSTMGAVYEFIDKPLKPWKTYYYWLESVDQDGNSVLSDPIKAKPPR